MSTGVRVTGVVLAALVLGLATSAFAAAGDGVRLGGSEGRLHPYLDLEGRYDSNVIYESPGQSKSDYILHFRPGVNLAVPGDTTEVKLDAALDWAQYLQNTSLSRLYAQATLGVGVNKKGIVGLELDDSFVRGNTTSTFTLGQAVISNLNTLTLGVPWRPGGGAMTVSALGSWRVESFEPYFSGSICESAFIGPACDSTTLAKLGYNELQGGAELRWRFLPKTAYILEGSYFDRIPDDKNYSAPASGVRFDTGAAGLITSKLAGTLKAGYGSTVGSTAAKFGTWLANVELEWIPSELGSLKVGYVHDLGIDAGSTVIENVLYQVGRAYLSGKWLVGARYALHLEGGWEERSYQAASATSTLWRIEPGVEVSLTRWARIMLAYAYTDRTSKNLEQILASPESLPGYNYKKSELWLRASLSY